MRIPLALAVLLTTAGMGQSPQTPTSSVHSVEIVLERTPCFGACPSYIVTLDGDGNVVYQGRQSVRVSGEQRTKIDPAKVVDLVREFQRIGFFDLQASYTANITDHPTTWVSLTLDGKSFRVMDYYGAPDPLRKLERMIDEVANTRHWVFLDPAAIKELQASPTPPSIADLDNYLDRAIQRDDVETARALLDAGATVRAGNGRVGSRSPLVSARSAEMVRLLVHAGVDPNDGLQGSAPPIVSTAGFSDVSVLDALLQLGANVNATAASGYTALMGAAEQGRVATVDLLLKAGANVRATDNSGKTAMDRTAACISEAQFNERFTGIDLRPHVVDCQQVIARLNAALAK